MKRTPISWIAIGLAVAGIALAGCGETNLFEGTSSSTGAQSDLEAGLEALDSSNWAEAQRIFSGMDQSDPDIRKYLASAYVGAAGFDMLELVDQIDAAQAAATPGDIIYDSVTSIFDDGSGTLTPAELETKVALVRDALLALGALEPVVGRVARMAGAVSFDTIAAENQFQSGIYSALYVVLLVVEQLQIGGEVFLTLDALGSNACSAIGGVTVVQPEFDDLLRLIREAVLVIVPGYMGGEADNDIADELDRFLLDIGYLPEGSVTSAELQSYLYGLLDVVCD